MTSSAVFVACTLSFLQIGYSLRCYDCLYAGVYVYSGKDGTTMNNSMPAGSSMTKGILTQLLDKGQEECKANKFDPDKVELVDCGSVPEGQEGWKCAHINAGIVKFRAKDGVVTVRTTSRGCVAKVDQGKKDCLSNLPEGYDMIVRKMKKIVGDISKAASPGDSKTCFCSGEACNGNAGVTSGSGRIAVTITAMRLLTVLLAVVLISQGRLS